MEFVEIILAILVVPAVIYFLVQLIRLFQDVAKSEVDERQSMVNLLDKIAQRLEDEKKK